MSGLLLRTRDFEGEWQVSRCATGAIIGTMTVQSGTDEGRARLRDAVTMLHAKFRLAPDPDLVERCGSVNTVPAAPRNRPLVLLDPEYDTNRKFWRASRHRGGIEWTKTTAHFYSEAFDGWMRETDKEDADMWPGASVLWTRGSPTASPKAAAPRKRRKR
jgi:hypothetical protein